jgi:hypothetical protein
MKVDGRDPTDDATERRPEDRLRLTLGRLVLDQVVPENEAAQRRIM